MGNIGSSAGNGRRRQGSRRSQPPPPPPMQQDTMTNRYMYSATPYPNPSGHNPYYQYPGYPPPPAITMPMPAPYDHHHHQHQHHRPPPMYPCPMMPAPAPYVEHQKAMTIRNDVNLKRETLKVEQDEDHPGSFLVAFTFDAMVAGSMTIIFFAKEGDDCDLTPTKEESVPPIIVTFEQGLGQKFKQPSGTGIDFSKFEESELLKEGNLEVFPLAIKAETAAASSTGDDNDANQRSSNSQITNAVFEKDKGQFRVKVVKQILWVSGMRYELHEIYGIGGNSVEGDIDDDGNDPGKECVICLSEPRDTTVLPCRHMCMCSGCAKVLSFQTNRCPICRQPVERFLEIKVNNVPESEGEETNNH